MATEQPGLDKLSSVQMAAWLRETAVNTRKHSDQTWCAARALPYDPVAEHVAFRIEQAADQLAALRWIPIGESLPPSGRKVLGYWKNELGKGRRTCVEYIAPRTLNAEDICWDDTPDDWFDCDESGTCWVPSGWYERVEGADEYPYTVIPVTHWQPLPEMPS